MSEANGETMSVPFDQELYSQIINRGPDNVPESYAEGWCDAADIAAQISANRETDMARSTGESLEAQMLRQKQHIVSLEDTLARYKARERKMQEQIDRLSQEMTALRERVEKAESSCREAERFRKAAYDWDYISEGAVMAHAAAPPPARIDPEDWHQWQTVAQVLPANVPNPEFWAKRILTALKGGAR